MDAARRIEELAEVGRVEAELDSFVEKRARDAADHERVEELWAKTEDEHQESRRQALAREWYDYHDCMARSHEATRGCLVRYHQKERAKYARVLGIPELSGNGKEGR